MLPLWRRWDEKLAPGWRVLERVTPCRKGDPEYNLRKMFRILNVAGCFLMHRGREGCNFGMLEK